MNVIINGLCKEGVVGDACKILEMMTRGGRSLMWLLTHAAPIYLSDSYFHGLSHVRIFPSYFPQEDGDHLGKVLYKVDLPFLLIDLRSFKLTFCEPQQSKHLPSKSDQSKYRNEGIICF